MNIVMITNTFTPHVGGVARSVESFTTQYRKRGYRVTVIAPEFPDMLTDEEEIIRVPALRQFNGSDFSVRLPIPVDMIERLNSFEPHIIHSHHPFMLGSTALRLAHHFRTPLVFTHHTMYERYTHYVPGDSPTMKRFVIELATGYANLCDHVIAPSESTLAVLRERNVQTPITVVPTGVDTEALAKGNGSSWRDSFGIPTDAFVIGHLGRLAPEKNLDFLARSVSTFMLKFPDSYFLVAGEGPCTETIKGIFDEAHLSDRLHFTGRIEGQPLVNCYKAMNVFAFASFTETQGMVLSEAMAAGVPVVALDAPGAREVVIDGLNGHLLPTEDEATFVAALESVATTTENEYAKLQNAALNRASELSIVASAGKALDLYEKIIEEGFSHQKTEGTLWESALEHLTTEWNILTNAADAVTAAIHLTPSKSDTAHD